MRNSVQASSWMRYALWAAACSNTAWGCFAVFFPLATFHWAGIPEPTYPELWQCIGMIVGVYGVGFGVAAFNPMRHWPVVLVGLLGKMLGPIGFVGSALRGRMPWRMGWTVIVNDLIWWVPFTLILLAAYRASLGLKRTASPEVQRMALRARTQYGDSLLELSEERPLLVVFLRHTGCTFCREAMSDISKQRAAIEAGGTQIILIHMSQDSHAGQFFAKYGLADVARVSDPEKHLYRAFGLSRGSFGMLFGPKVLWRGFTAGLLQGHGAGPMVGDGFQMPGVFLVYHGQVVKGFQHQTAADRPAYSELT